MAKALRQAEQAAAINEVPVGAVLVSEQGELLAAAFNQPIRACDPTAHAELLALRDAGRAQGNYRLPKTTLYVTIEPCTMCFGAIIHSRVGRLVYGAQEPKAGVICSQLQLPGEPFYNHKLSVTGGVLAAECSELISTFFARRRSEKKQGS